jgi:hypothetical protein
MAVFAALVAFCHLARGFANRDLVSRIAGLLGKAYGLRQATYDLRRLRRKGLIEKIAHSQYHLTALGRRVAVLYTKTYGRVLAPGLTAMDPALPPEVAARCPLAAAWRQLEKTLDGFIDSKPLPEDPFPCRGTSGQM